MTDDERKQFREMDRLAAQRDVATLVDASLHARDEGWAEALERGELIGMIYHTRRYLKLPEADIPRLRCLPLEELEKQLQELDQQFEARANSTS